VRTGVGISEIAFLFTASLLNMGDKTNLSLNNPYQNKL